MGEKIRILSQGKILDKEFVIELNKPNVSHMPRDIHIQSESFRYQLNEREFVHLALTILRAQRHLVFMKGLDADE